MGGAGLQFVNIQECEIFLVRYFSREFEDRAFFLPSQIDTLKTIEKSCKAASSWRMDSDHCASVALNFHEVPEVKMLINKLSEVDIQCGGCKSVSTFCGHFGIVPKFMNDEERDETGSKMRQCIDLLLCLLSPAVDYRDVWSVARFFGRVCAKVLPPLRRRAEQTSGHLNIMSVLLSYVMTSVLDGTGGDDPILSANFAVLKNFTDTITKMTDLLQDDLHPTVAIREMVTTAVTYLRSLKCFTGLTELCKVQKFVTKQLANIEANFATLSALACNDYQDLSIYTKKHVLAFALRDRLVCLDCITDIGEASPLFRSPSVAPPTVCTQSPMENKVTKTKEELTSSSSSSRRHSARFVSFLKFDTPKMNTEQLVTTVSSLDSGVFEDAFGDDKENVHPDALVLLKCEKKGETSMRRKIGKAVMRVRDMNRTSAKSNLYEGNLASFSEEVEQQLRHNKRASEDSCELLSECSGAAKKCHSRGTKRKTKMQKLSDGQVKLTSFFGRLHNS